jgi:hypothetical protein
LYPVGSHDAAICRAARTVCRYAPPVPKVDVAALIIDESVAVKIRTKHPPLTAEDLRAAILYSRNIQTRWQEHEEHGRRLVVRGRTYQGVEFVAYLLPAVEHDPEEGTFVLKTAIPMK